MAKRLKTAHDSTSNSKLSFHGLVDILEPDGPPVSTNWRSIVDRKEQVIVFFQVQYMQFIPQLSKCIRIRRDRTKTFEEILVPSVFFGRYLDDSFVEKAFGKTHLTYLNDLQTLLNVVDQSEKLANFQDEFDGEQDNDLNNFSDDLGSFKAAFSSVDDESVPVYSNLVITQVSSPSETSLRSSLDNSEKVEKKFVKEKYSKKLLDEENGLSVDAESDEETIDEPPCNPSLVKVFNSVLHGDKKPHPPPLLDCQMRGAGKVPLTKASVDGKLLYIAKQDMKNLRSNYSKRASLYLSKLIDILLAPRGQAFIKRRREERRIAIRGTTLHRKLGQTPVLLLLAKDFLYLLEGKRKLNVAILRHGSVGIYTVIYDVIGMKLHIGSRYHCQTAYDVIHTCIIVQCSPAVFLQF